MNFHDVTRFLAGDSDVTDSAIPSQGHVAHQKVDGGDQQTQNGDGKSDFEKIPERELVTVLFCYTSTHYVGGGPY